MRRSLSLRREALADLTPEDLLAVNGAGNEAISLPLVGGCLDSLRVPCYVDSYQPTRCMCP